jgi:hypothetical protein
MSPGNPIEDHQTMPGLVLDRESRLNYTVMQSIAREGYKCFLRSL